MCMQDSALVRCGTFLLYCPSHATCKSRWQILVAQQDSGLHSTVWSSICCFIGPLLGIGKGICWWGLHHLASSKIYRHGCKVVLAAGGVFLKTAPPQAPLMVSA